MNSTVNAFELQSSMLQTLTNCVAISTHRNTSMEARGVFMADTPNGVCHFTNCSRCVLLWSIWVYFRSICVHLRSVRIY